MHDTLTLAISLEGDALLDGDDIDTHELARILRAQADRMEAGDLDALLDGGTADQHPVRDVNGNTVGAWCYRPHTVPAAGDLDPNGDDWGARARQADLPTQTECEAAHAVQVEASGWSLWLGAPEAAPWADLLDSLPTLSTGDGSDLKVDRGGVRVWLSRLTLGDGEPFDRTVHVERSDANGTWRDCGYFDGGFPNPEPGDSWLHRAHDITCDMVWETQQ